MNKDHRLFDVYHTTTQLSYFYPESDRWSPYDSSYFHKVATIRATSETEVFYISNHHGDGEESWTDSPEVEWYRNKEVRSTSVGDVIHCPAERKAWLVGREGMEEIFRVFTVEENGIRILCEQRDKDFVLRFLLKRTAKLCWRFVERSGKWSGVLYEEDGMIKFPADLASQEYLYSLASQYVAGRERFEWSVDDEDSS